MKNYFGDLTNYYEYLDQNNIFDLLEIDKTNVNKDQLNRNIVPDPYLSVDPENKVPFPPELDDLCRLHYLVKKEKLRLY